MEEPTSVPVLTSRKRIIAALVLGVAAATTTGLALRLRAVMPRAGTRITIGRPLPSLMVHNSEGGRTDLSAISAGRRRVVAFYSPTCDACQRELPELQPFPAGLELVMIRAGELEGTDALGARFGSRINYVDRDNVFSRAFAIAALPTLLFVDENGFVRDGLIGTHPPEVVRRKLASFAGGHA